MKARLLLIGCLFLVLLTRLAAQPTYRLDVRKDLAPRATLSLKGTTLTRSPVADDPGFRLQFHFQKAGKTLTMPDARTATSIALPSLEAGDYTVVLELFHPGYKGGKVLKGQFRAVSDPLAYRITPGSPPRVQVLPSAKPAPPAKPSTPAPKR